VESRAGTRDLGTHPVPQRGPGAKLQRGYGRIGVGAQSTLGGKIFLPEKYV